MDPVRTELMRNRFAAIAEEASTIAYRSAHTTFVKQTQDYQCALATVAGDFFAYPQQSGVIAYVGISLKAAIDHVGINTLRPGDVIITNDPFSTDGLCSHTPDIHLIKPIFSGDRVIALGWAFIHASDIGGAVPGSISALSTEIFQEGIRMRPVLLYAAGVLNQQLLDLFQDNCRIPDDVWGDLQAMVSALNTMERRMGELCTKLGVEEVIVGVGEVLDLAEVRARAAILRIPDGRYEFSDYVEGMRREDLTFIHVAMTVRGDEIELDFSGSDPQVQSSINFVSGSRTHPFLSAAIIFYIVTAEPTTPVNGGIVRPIRTRAPKGTVMNAEFPAASGNRWVTAVRIFDAVLGCLNQAVPGGVAASGPGQSAVIAVTARDPVTRRKRVNVINPFCGGSGGRAVVDGVDGVDGPQASLKNTPTEIVETETLMRVRQYQLAADTFAAGQWRGGAAIVMEIENTDFEAVMAVRGLNRFQFASWGIFGGQPGALGEVVLNPGRTDERAIERLNILELKQGDIVRMTTPTGGGFGDPLLRDPALVETDVRSGLLSEDKATADYGVVFMVNGAVDAEATRMLRQRMKAGRNALEPVCICDQRSRYQHIWPVPMREEFARAALREEPSIRAHLFERVHRKLLAEAVPVTKERLAACLAAERRNIEGKGASKHQEAI
jgi:N-methylhydantoinase B